MIVNPFSTFLRIRSLRGLCAFAYFVCLPAAPILWGADAETAKTHFDLPADILEKSVKRFAAQSDLEVLIPGDAVAAVQTNAVRGELSSRQALDAMLAGTGLTVLQDAKSGAFAVRRRPPDSNRQEPKTSGDSAPAKKKR